MNHTPADIYLRYLNIELVQFFRDGGGNTGFLGGAQ
jgi:hypothetical protein